MYDCEFPCELLVPRLNIRMNSGGKLAHGNQAGGNLKRPAQHELPDE